MSCSLCTITKSCLFLEGGQALKTLETQVWESKNKSYFTLYTSRQLSLWVQKIGVYGECVVPAHRSEHYILLINRKWGHYREISDYIKAKVWDFLVMTKQTRLISIKAFSLWTWACNQLKPTTGQQITLKKHATSVSCTVEPTIQPGDTGQQIPFLTAVNWP